MRHVADILEDKSEDLVWIGPLESIERMAEAALSFEEQPIFF